MRNPGQRPSQGNPRCNGRTAAEVSIFKIVTNGAESNRYTLRRVMFRIAQAGDRVCRSS